MINIPTQLVPISAFSSYLPKLWHSGADVIHLLPYIQSMISDEDETDNSKNVGNFSEYPSTESSIASYIPSSIDLQEDQEVVKIGEVQSKDFSDGFTTQNQGSCQSFGGFPEKKRVRRHLYADKNTDTRELALPSTSHSYSPQSHIRQQDVPNNDLTLPGPYHLEPSSIDLRVLAASNNDLTLPGLSYAQSNLEVYQELSVSKRGVTPSDAAHHQPITTPLGELPGVSNTLSLPSTSTSHFKEASSEKHAASNNELSIYKSSPSQPTVSHICQSEVTNRLLSLSTPFQIQPVPATTGVLDTCSKSFVSAVDGIEDIADVDNLVGMILLYQHLFNKRTSPCESKDFSIGELDDFTIELENLDRIYYVYHFDDGVSSREYELLARMNYKGGKVFVHLSASCDYTGFDFQGTGEIHVTKKANLFLKSVVDGSNNPKKIWQALQADGYNVSEPTEFDLLPPGLWQSVPTLAFLSHMAVYQHREKLTFYPEVLPPLLRHNLDDFIQVRSTKDHHDS